MTTRQAFEFIAKYGNCTTDVDDLMNSRPTKTQLNEAFEHCNMVVRTVFSLAHQHFEERKEDYEYESGRYGRSS